MLCSSKTSLLLEQLINQLSNYFHAYEIVFNTYTDHRITRQNYTDQSVYYTISVSHFKIASTLCLVLCCSKNNCTLFYLHHERKKRKYAFFIISKSPFLWYCIRIHIYLIISEIYLIMMMVSETKTLKEFVIKKLYGMISHFMKPT